MLSSSVRRICGEFFHSMPCITIKHVRIWLCIKIARSNGRSNALAASPQFRFSWATPSILPDLIFGKDNGFLHSAVDRNAELPVYGRDTASRDLPRRVESEGRLTYRIKSASENFERTAEESELTLA